MNPRFFKNADEFRAWLEKNHHKSDELWVGYHSVASGRPSMKWAEAVDVALCYGWIDGVIKPLGDERRAQRFTPRRAKSKWSKRNVDRVNALRKAGLMRPAGLEAFERRVAAGYSYEDPGEFPAELLKRFRANKKAWTFFESLPPYHRRVVTNWVATAKRDETREKRFAELFEACKKGERLARFAPLPRKKA